LRPFLAAALCLLSTAAFAADPAPKPPTCGKTTEECQVVVDGLRQQLTEARAAYQLARQQRINVETAKDDADLNAALPAAVQQAIAQGAGSGLGGHR